MVLSNYKFTCALTRYRLTTVSSECIVDAAHIHRFSASRDNDPHNGLALCKNAHWLFDNGMWSLRRRYRVIIARPHFDEECLDPRNQGFGRLRRSQDPPAAEISPGGLLSRDVRWHRKYLLQGGHLNQLIPVEPICRFHALKMFASLPASS